MGIEEDRFMNKIENKLSNAAASPIGGSFAGLAHVTVGAVQAISGLAVAIISAPYAFKDPTLTKHAWHHLEHGLGNVAVGAIETIPFAGGALKAARQSRLPKDDGAVHAVTGHEEKWMPYSSLVINDSQIVGNDNQHRKDAQVLFENRKNTDRILGVKPSVTRIKHLSKKSIIDSTPPMVAKYPIQQ